LSKNAKYQIFTIILLTCQRGEEKGGRKKANHKKQNVHGEVIRIYNAAIPINFTP